MSPIWDPDKPKEHHGFHMKITPKTEAAIKEDMLLPAGEYDFEVLGAEDKVSKNGNEMIVVKLGVFRPSGGVQYVTDYLMEKIAYKLRHFCYATGIGDKYESGDLAAVDCGGRSGRVMLKIEEQDGFDPKNVVKDYCVVGKETAKAPNAAPKLPAAAVNADEPPF